ncbi:MAG: hypothetical protein LBM71_00755 [Elusimicrobiota bacterium]|jgi:hypothetical protein|nr:hypothetical protein [Elusimicrobiota bacterium]
MQNALKTNLLSGLSTGPLAAKPAWQPQANWQWPNIRQNINEGAVALLICDAYPYFGFKAEATGGYKVYINGELYSAYSSGAKCSFALADLEEISTPYNISYPAAHKAYIIEIRPQTAPAITKLICDYHLAPGEQQAALWLHFQTGKYPVNISYIGSYFLSGIRQAAWNNTLKAITAKDNALKVSSCTHPWPYFETQTLPVLDISSCTASFSPSGCICGIASSFTLKGTALNKSNMNFAGAFYQSSSISQTLERVLLNNVDTSAVKNWSQTHQNSPKLKLLPSYDFMAAEDMSSFLTNAINLQDTYLDLSYAHNLKILGIYGTATNRIDGLKGLKVSSLAPFSSSALQINVRYTGLDHNALRILFESLPQVSAAQTIDITGALGAEDLIEADLSIATAKGWTVIY